MREEEAVDSRTLRQALGCFPTGVAVITTRVGKGRPVGLTCSSFNSVSLNPPLVLWSLRNESRSFAAFDAAEAFAVNVLAEDQAELSTRFATSGEVEKFAGVDHRAGVLGMPLIEGSVAQFECRKWAQYSAGDHTIFIGEVKALVATRPESSLVFYKGSYMELGRSLRKIATDGSLSPLQLHEAVSLVYGSVARLGCLRGNVEDFQAIEAHLRDMANLVGPERVAARNQAGMEFFRLVARTAHNDALATIADTLNSLMHHVFLSRGSVRFRSELVPLRWQIVKELQARDGEGAVSAIQSYFQTRLVELQAS